MKNCTKSADKSRRKSGVIFNAFSRSAEKGVNPAKETRRYRKRIVGGRRARRTSQLTRYNSSTVGIRRDLGETSMEATKQDTNWTFVLAGLTLVGGLVTSTGCQVSVSGQTLPSAYYLHDDVQYFPAGPENKLANETAALKAAAAEAKSQQGR
jgi:hypothetical protein